MKRSSERFALPDELGSEHTIVLELSSPSMISAIAEWQGDTALAIILNGPGQVQYYARNDGRSPLSLNFNVTDQLLTKGRRWTLRLVNFHPRGPVEGTIEISRPPNAAVSIHAAPRSLAATRVLNVGERVLALAIAPDGKLVAAGGGGGTGILSQQPAVIHLWRDGAKLGALKGHQTRIRAIAFAPDGKTFVSVDGDPIAGGVGIVWDTRRRSIRAKHRFPDGGIYDAKFLTNGRTLALAGGSRSGLVELWDIAKAKVLKTLTGSMGRVTGIAISPDDQLIACGTLDKKVYIWGIGDQRLLHTIDGFKQAPDALAFSPDGKALAVSGYYETETQIFDTKTWLAEMTLPTARHLAYSPDGRFLAIADFGSADVTIWDPFQGVAVGRLNGNKQVAESLVFSRDSRWLLTGDDTAIRFWDMTLLQSAQKPNHAAKEKQATSPFRMSQTDEVRLQFNLREGDTFQYQSTFGSSTRPYRTVFRFIGSAVQVTYPDDPDNDFVTVLDQRGFPVDFLHEGVSIKDQLPNDVWDISTLLVFPEGPVRVGDVWEVDNQRGVRVKYRLVKIGVIRGRDVAEIHSTASGDFTGPIKFWLELGTGMLVRKEYLVGSTKTVMTRM